MIPFLLRRLVSGLVILLVVSFIAFALIDFMPGDAADTLVGEFASSDQIALVRQELGLNLPIFSRYMNYMTAAIVSGDLGDSYISGRAVSTLIAERFPYTLALAVVSLTIAGFLGGIVGLIAATHPGSYVDTGLMGVTTLGLSIPTFWLALLLILVFCLRLRLLPVVGAGTPSHIILPAICLALPLMAVVARLVRSSVLDVRHQDFVRTAYAKGLRRHQIWTGHIIRNSLIPVLTVMAIHAGHLLGGTFIIETIFGWPGLGRLTVQAILDSDLPIVLGSVILIAAIYQLINFSVDVMQAILDPRVGVRAL